MKLDRASDLRLSELLARNLYLDRTFQFDADRERNIQSLTLGSVNAVIKKCFEPSNMTSVFAGDFKEEPKEGSAAPK